MQGLMFNLLEKLARKAGCADDAWDLIAEFGSANSGGNSSDCPSPNADCADPARYREATLAMLACLDSDSDLAVEQLFDCDVADLWEDDLEDGFSQEDVMPQTPTCGFGPAAFASSPLEPLAHADHFRFEDDDLLADEAEEFFLPFRARAGFDPTEH